jgi:hypothetical protein
MAGGWAATPIDDIPTVPDSTVTAAWKPLRDHFGIRAFGINAWIAGAAGEDLIEEHDELPEEGEGGGHEEIYAVVRGRATFTVDGERVDAPAGQLVYVRDTRLVRSAVAEEAGTAVIAIGAEPGRAFEPSDWEQRRLG